MKNLLAFSSHLAGYGKKRKNGQCRKTLFFALIFEKNHLFFYSVFNSKTMKNGKFFTVSNKNTLNILQVNSLHITELSETNIETAQVNKHNLLTCKILT